MKIRISSACIIVPIIVLGVIFLITPSTNAQSTSPPIDQYEMARLMTFYSLSFKGCEETQSQIANVRTREKLEKLYQNYVQKKTLEKKPRADYEKAKAESDQAEKAFNDAHEKWESMDEKCKRAVEVTKLDPKKIQSCLDAVSFWKTVIEPRFQTMNAKYQVAQGKRKIVSSYEKASSDAHGMYLREVWNNLDIDYYYLTRDEYYAIYDADPNQLKRVVKDICSRYKSGLAKLIQQATSVTDSMIKDCNEQDAEYFLNKLPDYPGKEVLQQHIKDARLREDVARVNYEEGRDLYRKGRIEEMEGRVSQAQDLYRKAIAKMQEGRKLTNCDSRVKQFDKAIGQINSRLAQKGTTKIGNCDVPKDFAAQKRALHARIKRGNTFRQDGGGQWNPTFVMRAGYSVGSETLKATALALSAMTNLIEGYEKCYATYWSFMEGELVQLTKARDAAYKRSWAEGQKISGVMQKRKDEVARALDTCIVDKDNTFKAAMKKAQELCK
jgi:tetratricopeptide (TPR) repeat protein